MEDPQHRFRPLAVVSHAESPSLDNVKMNLIQLNHSAILTTLQIDAAASEPVTRYSALMSLVCALMSLLYGCMYIIRFGTMRKTHKAAEWAAVRTPVFFQIPELTRPNSGGTENQNNNFMECLGASRNAFDMVVLVNHLLLSKSRIYRITI